MPFNAHSLAFEKQKHPLTMMQIHIFLGANLEEEGGVICPNSSYTAQAGSTMLLSVWLLGSLFQDYA